LVRSGSQYDLGSTGEHPDLADAGSNAVAKSRGMMSPHLCQWRYRQIRGHVRFGNQAEVQIRGLMLNGHRSPHPGSHRERRRLLRRSAGGAAFEGMRGLPPSTVITARISSSEARWSSGLLSAISPRSNTSLSVSAGFAHTRCAMVWACTWRQARTASPTPALAENALTAYD
jgi:hypothetical protein